MKEKYMLKVKTKDGLSRLSIGGEMTIHTANGQKEKLLQSLAECDEIEIDLAQVSELDAAGLQLLLLMKMEALKAGKKVWIVEYSPAFIRAFNLYNLKHHFGTPMALPAIV